MELEMNVGIIIVWDISSYRKYSVGNDYTR